MYGHLASSYPHIQSQIPTQMCHVTKLGTLGIAQAITKLILLIFYKF